MRTRLDFATTKKFLFASNFKVSEKNPLEKVMSQYAAEYDLNPLDFTEANLRSWGCRNWDGEIILLAPRMVQFLPIGTILYDIHNEIVEVGKEEIDMDTRAGVVAFGVKFAGLKQEERLIEERLQSVTNSVSVNLDDLN